TIGSGGTATSLPITVTIAASASTGPRSLTVTTPAGTSAPFSSFTVTTEPAITGIFPSSGPPGTSLPATISGANLSGATAVSLSGSGLKATIGTGGTATTLPIPITIEASAPAGTRNFSVLTPAGPSPPFTGFTVTKGPPVISDLTATPSGLSQALAPLYGGSFTLTVNGRNFDTGTQVQWGTTPLSTSFVSATQVTAVVHTPQLTTPGPVL